MLFLISWMRYLQYKFATFFKILISSNDIIREIKMCYINRERERESRATKDFQNFAPFSNNSDNLK